TSNMSAPIAIRRMQARVVLSRQLNRCPLHECHMASALPCDRGPTSEAGPLLAGPLRSQAWAAGVSPPPDRRSLTEMDETVLADEGAGGGIEAGIELCAAFPRPVPAPGAGLPLHIRDRRWRSHRLVVEGRTGGRPGRRIGRGAGARIIADDILRQDGAGAECKRGDANEH